MVNRDEPVPVIVVSGGGAASSDGESKRDRLKQSLSGARLKGKLQDAGANVSDNSRSLQDRIFAKCVNHLLNAIVEDEVPFQEMEG